jgi:hypothetical protein
MARGRALAALLALLGACTELRADESNEHAVKAAFVSKFARFVEWPQAGRCPDHFTIAVLGKDAFTDALQRAIEGREVRERPTRVRRVTAVGQVEPCSLLWLGAAEEKHLEAVLGELGRVPVLVVGDATGFTSRGGMIGLFVENERVGFDVNVGAAERAGLRISSRLLGLARAVAKGDEGKRR